MEHRRKTIDGMQIRPRPRSYLDQHVPRQHIERKIVQDVMPSVQISPVQATNVVKPEQLHKISITDVSHVARTIVSPTVPVAPLPTPVPKASPQQIVAPIEISTSSQSTVTLETEAQALPVTSDITRKVMEIQAVTNAPGVDSAPKTFQPKALIAKLFESRRSIAMTAASLVLMVGGSVALISSIVTNNAVNAQVQTLNEVASAQDSNLADGEAMDSDQGLPSEDEVPEPVVNAYSPPADEPRYIHIPKLKNRKTRVLKMGIDKLGAIKTPRTTWDTGWFEGSSKPGDPVGAALIVGHVSGLTSGGVFYNLYRVENGDEIIVEMGDGTKYTYRVVGKEEVPLESIDMNNYLISKNIDKPGLTLMTCAGEYNSKTQTFDSRLAVFAVRD